LIQLKIAIWGSVMVNICLFCLQLVAAIISGSLSLLATMADSFMDLLSSGVLLFAERAANRTSFINYPTVGKLYYNFFYLSVWFVNYH